jgi:intracellular sulfur oxidation DsrE/DsrF family protein
VRKLFVILLILPAVIFGKYNFKEPKPSFDKPRKIIMKLNSKDIHKANHMLGTIYNILKEYPDGALKVVVVAYGPGLNVLKKDYDKKTLSRFSSLMEYDVEFIGCINTMQTMGWKRKDFIDDIDYVQAGVVEIIERQADNFIDATPY